MSYIKNYLHSKTNLENEMAIQDHSIEKLEPFKDLHAIHERDWDILLNAVQKVDKLLLRFSGICAAVAVQPIPFADIFILTPIQLYMGTR